MIINHKLLLLAFIPVIFVHMGCAKTSANTDNDVKSIIEKQVKLQGKFKRSFETHELHSNGTTYYVSDPKQLLTQHSKEPKQIGYYRYFDTCVIASVSPTGTYGPLGKYQNQVTVHSLCQ